MHQNRTVIDNEEARLTALRDLRLLDTPPSESFDRITRLASRLLGAPVSTISLTDSDRQWFMSKFGLDIEQIPRERAPCSYAIGQSDVFVVPDMREDQRFACSPLADAGIRFYAGAPLITRSGHGLGTLAVVDDRPRDLDDDQRRVLRDLAAMVMTQIEIQNTIGRIDASTGLPNQHQLFEDLEDLGNRHAGEERVGMLLELTAPERMSHGYRVLGTAYAEQMVRQASGLIRRTLGPDLRFYQIGAAHFVVLLDEAQGYRRDKVADELERGLRGRIDCAGIPVTLHPAIGIYAFTAGAVFPRDVLRRLFGATDDARGAGQTRAAYCEARDEAHARSFTLLNDIASALERRDQLSLVFQPRVELATGRCVGAEALLRWQHPVFGAVPPGEFIPLVEQTAIVGPVTDWVLNAAIRQVARWGRRAVGTRISINASALNLEEPGFAGRVGEMLWRNLVDPSAIELEFTESALASDGAQVLDALRALKDMGVEIAIDDFGTGYSSLSYLQQLPASIIKIDRSFMQRLTTSERDRTLVRAMISMAHDLGFRVVAEGIETQEVYELLVSWGCDEGQGYHIARPMPAGAFEEWLGLARRLTDGADPVVHEPAAKQA